MLWLFVFVPVENFRGFLIMISLCVLLCTSTYAYENLALRKPTWQSSTHDVSKSGPGRAVDGLKTDLSFSGNQCSVTGPRQTSTTWFVNLNEVRSIHSIKIYYRTDNIFWNASNQYAGRFLGFYLYISNTTTKQNGHLCFHNTKYNLSTIPAVIEVQCPIHGQRVIYYNERLPGETYPNGYSQYAVAELCEVEVYGCSDSKVYGSNCSIPCPSNCMHYCHIESGACFDCKPGYKEERCDQECNKGYFGKHCTRSCISTCDGCNNVNGSCDRGCIPGWKGNSCQTPCSGRMYGRTCQEICGFCENLQQCHHINGTCLNGCSEGYYEDHCKTPCKKGFYGKNCKQSCISTCDGCNAFNGSCDKGCNPGWKGTSCQAACDGNMYGKSCKEKCGFCEGFQQCHHINGTCSNGCDEGFQGHNCKSPCDGGTYGEKCNKTCGRCFNKEHCHFIDGSCKNGCARGFLGLHCIKECEDGSFGLNCSNQCNTTCKNCNKVTGICDNRCHPGWKGEYCQKECEGGFFGENCNISCGYCFRSEQCHHINATCFNGCSAGYQGNNCTEICEPGYFGVNCEEECSSMCKNSHDCHPVTGYCNNGCKRGWQGNDCLQVKSKQMKTTNAIFLSGVGGLGVTVIVFGIFCAKMIFKRLSSNSSGVKEQKKCRMSSSALQRKEKAGKSFVRNCESAFDRYEELGETGPSSYEMITK